MAINLRTQLTFAVAAAAFAAGFGLSETRKTLAREPLPRFMPLLATSKTVMDEPIVYPPGTAKLTTGIVALAPGEQTGWHTHGVPLTGILLDGELTVDYGAKGQKVFRKGDSIAEAISVPHNGRNTGQDVMRLFAVFIGADGVALSAPAAGPGSSQPEPSRP